MATFDVLQQVAENIAKDYVAEYLPDELPYLSLLWQEVLDSPEISAASSLDNSSSLGLLERLSLNFAQGASVQLQAPAILVIIRAVVLEMGGQSSLPTEEQVAAAIQACSLALGASKSKAKHQVKRLKGMVYASLVTFHSDMSDDDESLLNSERSEYIVWISSRDGAGALRYEVSVNELTNDYLSTKKQKAYDIFVDRLKVLVRSDDKHVLWPLSESHVRMLIILLINKERTVYANYLETKALSVGKPLSADLATLNSATEKLRKAMQRLRQDPVAQQLKGFRIADKGDMGSYMCTGKFSFCVVVDKAIEDQFVFPSE